MYNPTVPTSLDKQQIELVGTAALTAALIREGFEIARPIRDRGIDLIVFSDASARSTAILLQVKVHSETGLDVSRERYRNFPDLVYAVVWQALSQPRYFLFDHGEALKLIPEASRLRDAFIRKNGHWVWNHPVPRHLRLSMAPFENRWEWLRSRLVRTDPVTQI